MALVGAFVAPTVHALARPTPSSQATPISPATVSQFHLAPGDFYPRDLVAGPDGNFWFTSVQGQPGVTGPGAPHEPVIERITPQGLTTEFRLPSFAIGLTVAPDGVWYVREEHVGRIAPNGNVIEFSVPTGYYPGDITLGPDGNLWITKRDDLGQDAILRVTPSGQVTAFPLPAENGQTSGPGAITVGPDGNLWFTENYSSRIGRMTPAGEVTEWRVPHRPQSAIAAGPDGNIWFVAEGHIGRMTPSGELKEFPVKDPSGPITSGPDGRIWFGQGYGTISRITPDGRFSKVKLPFAASDVTGLFTGPGNALWYTAVGDYPCEGGGGTCMIYQPENPGIVGKVVPGPLSVRIGASHALHRARWVRFRLRCLGGDAGDRCRGTFTLSRNGVEVSSRRYRLAVDAVRQIAVQLPRWASRALRLEGRLRLTATATVNGGRRDRAEAVIRLRG